MSADNVVQLSRELNRELAKDSLPAGGPPRLHQSIAKTLLTESPLHAWRQHRQLGAVDRDPTKEMEFGTVVHRLVLGTGADYERLSFSDYRKKAAKTARDESRKRGLVPILEHEFQRAQAVADIVTEKLQKRGIHLTGESERFIEWDERATGGAIVKCAGTLDHVLLIDQWGRIYDLKTSESANPERIERQMVNMGADIQWAAYTSAADKAFGLHGRVEMFFLYAETHEPFCLTIAKPDGAMRALGQRRWERAIDLWHSCLTRNEWPEYSTGVVEISAPPWALKKEMEDE